MIPPRLSVGSSFVYTAFAFVLVAGGLISPASAQNYMFGLASLQTGTKPSGVGAADFNGDGRADLAVANQGDNTVSVMLTQPDGTFASKVDYPVGNTPFQVVTSDFNGDGIMDLAVVNTADNTVSLLFGVGDGTFASTTTFPVGKTPVAIAAGDFDGDGKMDLAIANQSDDTVSILLGTGKGAFTSQPTVPINGAPYYLLSGDVNNDRKADLFVLGGTPTSSSALFLLTSTGNGAFSGANIGGGFSIANMALGDLNNDGNLDIAFANSSSDSVSILLGNGAGTFRSQSLFTGGPLGAPPQSVAVGDFNRDANLDLAVSQTYFIAVYNGNGDGTFGSPMLGGIPSFTIPLLLVPTDFNNDAQLDLAVVIPDYNVALIVLGNGDGTLASRTDISLPASGGLGGQWSPTSITIENQTWPSRSSMNLRKAASRVLSQPFSGMVMVHFKTLFPLHHPTWESRRCLVRTSVETAVPTWPQRTSMRTAVSQCSWEVATGCSGRRSIPLWGASPR